MSEERPPYVEFHYKPVEDRAATITNGHYTSKDVAFAHIWRAGSKDKLEKEADAWLAGIEKAAREGMIPDNWFKFFSEKYSAWKKGEELPASGTPIKGWPVVSPAAQAMIIRAGYLTVEDLALSSDNEVSGIGMGAIGFKQKAKTWLEAAEQIGKPVEKISALEAKVSDLERLAREQMQTIKELQDKLVTKAVSSKA
jgi:hypothetical protein